MNMSNMTNMNMTMVMVNDTMRCSVPIFEGVERDIAKGMTLGIVGLLGLIGNIFTIALIFSFKKRHVPDILVLSLAFNDIFSVLLPFNIALAAYFYPLRLPQGHWSCELMTLLSLLSRVMSMFLHSLIAVDRFLAIAKPLEYRRLVKPITSVIIISLFFFISLLFSVIPWVYDSTLDPTVSEECLQLISYSIQGICLFDYIGWYPIIISILGWGQMFLFFIVFITTMTITMRYYYKRTRLLKGNDRILQESLNRSSISRKDSKKEPRIMKHITKLGSKMKERKLTEWLWLEFSFEFQFMRMLFFLSILFYATWAPSLIIVIYTQIFFTDNGTGERPEEIIFWGIRIATINIFLNPIIYALCSTQYRQAYWYAMKKYLFCCCKRYFTQDKISPFDRDEKRRRKKHQFLSGISDITGENVTEPQQSFTRGAQLPGLTTISENSLPRGLGQDPASLENEKLIPPFSLFKKTPKIKFEDERASLRTQETQDTSVSFTSASPDSVKKVDTGAIPTDEGVSIFTLKRQVFEGFNVAPRMQAAKGRGRLSKILSESPKDKVSMTVKVKGEHVLESEKKGKSVHRTLPRLYSTPYDEDSDPSSISPKVERTGSQIQKRTSLNLT